MSEPKCSYCRSDLYEMKYKFIIDNSMNNLTTYSCIDQMSCLVRICNGLRKDIMSLKARSAVEATASPKVAIYVITCTSGFNTGQYWSNSSGWVALEEADRYMQDELSSYALPDDGRWAQL